EARARIETLRARIAGGADFQAVAQESSDDTLSREDGGDLGWFTEDEFGPEFGGQVAALEDGQVSAPFRTQAGWHIVQRVGSRQASVDDENRRAQVRESIGQRKLEDEWDRYLREMRGEAYVDIRVGNTAAGGGHGASAPGAGPGRTGRRGAGAVRACGPAHLERRPRGVWRRPQPARRLRPPRPAAAAGAA